MKIIMENWRRYLTEQVNLEALEDAIDFIAKNVKDDDPHPFPVVGGTGGNRDLKASAVKSMVQSTLKRAKERSGIVLEPSSAPDLARQFKEVEKNIEAADDEDVKTALMNYQD